LTHQVLYRNGHSNCEALLKDSGAQIINKHMCEVILKAVNTGFGIPVVLFSVLSAPAG
jgi:hypothetical protein